MKATSSDIDTILYRFADAEDPADEDVICNMLIGLKDLHDSRVMQLLEVYRAYPGDELQGFATDEEAGFKPSQLH